MTLKEALNLLELSDYPTETEVERAYRDMMKIWHPDRFPLDPELQNRANQRTKEINAAYDLIKSRQSELVKNDSEQTTTSNVNDKENLTYVEPLQKQKPRRLQPIISRLLSTTGGDLLLLLLSLIAGAFFLSGLAYVAWEQRSFSNKSVVGQARIAQQLSITASKEGNYRYGAILDNGEEVQLLLKSPFLSGKIVTLRYVPGTNIYRLGTDDGPLHEDFLTVFAIYFFYGLGFPILGIWLTQFRHY